MGPSFRARFPHLVNWLGCAALLLLALLTGRSDAVDAIQDNAAFPAGELAPRGIGQTFVSRYPRLHAIEVRWIVSDDLQAPSASRAVMHLYRAGDTHEIAAAALPLSAIRHNEYGKFVFAPLPDSEGASYYFKIDVAPAEIQRGYLSLWTSGEDSYADGQMYMQVATDRDLDFRTYYEPDAAMLLWALARMLMQYGTALLIASLALLLPGAAFLVLVKQSGGLDGWALAGAAGLAMLSAVSLVQIFLPVPAGAIVLALAGIVVARRAVLYCSSRGFSLSRACGLPDFRSLRDFGSLELGSPAKLCCKSSSRRLGLPEFEVPTLGLLFLLALAVSLLQIRDVQIPLWVDSVTHAGTIQNLLVNGRLPADNLYHFGYHATAALLTQLTGLSIPQTMLLLGQMLVLQVGLSVFALTRRLLASTGAGLVAAIAVWFLSPTPSYFVTWGRYPLLMGAAILPLALYAAVELVELPHWNRRAIGFAAVCFAGLVFAHVRLAAFYVVFVVCLLYLHIRRAAASDRRRRYSLFQMVIALGAGATFGLAWFALLLLRGLNWQTVLSQSVRLSSPDLAGALTVLSSHHGPALWLLASLGLLVGILRRTTSALVCLAWYTALFAVAALPPDKVGGEYLSPGLVLLMLYLPAAILAAEVIHWLYDRWGMGSGAVRAAWATALIVVALIGARDMVSIVNPATVLFSSSDERAMEWIKEKTPMQAKFLVNSFLWTPIDYAVADGGAWIPYLTGRPIVWRQMQTGAPVTAADAGFIYLGWRNGVRTRDEFACQPERYRLVYNQGGVAIFQVNGADQPLDAVPSPFACDLQG